MITFAYEPSGQPIWRFWLTCCDLPAGAIQFWCFGVDGCTGEILESVQRMPWWLSNML